MKTKIIVLLYYLVGVGFGMIVEHGIPNEKIFIAFQFFFPIIVGLSIGMVIPNDNEN